MAVLFILLLVAVANAQSAFDREWSRESYLNVGEDEFTGYDLKPLLNLRFSNRGARVISTTATEKDIELLPSLRGTTGYMNGGLKFGFDTNGVWSIGNIDFRDPDTFWDICPEGYTVSDKLWCTDFDDDLGDYEDEYEDEYTETFPWVDDSGLYDTDDVRTCVNLCYSEDEDDYLPVTEPNQDTGLLFKMTINFGEYDRVCWAVDAEEGSETEAMLQMIWDDEDWKGAWVRRFGNTICSGVDGEYPIASPWGRDVSFEPVNMGTQAIFSLPVIGENTYPGANMLRFYPRKGYLGPVYEESREFLRKRQLEDATDTEHSSLYGVGSPTGAFNLALTLTRIPKDNTKEDDFLCSYDRVHYIFHLYSGGTLAATWKVYADHEINLEDGRDHTILLAAPRVAEWDHSSDQAWPLLYIDGRPICASTNNYYPWDATKLNDEPTRKTRQATNEFFELGFTRALAGFRALLSEVPSRVSLYPPCRADCPGCEEYCDVCNDIGAVESCDWPQCEICDTECETCTQPNLDDGDGGCVGPECGCDGGDCGGGDGPNCEEDEEACLEHSFCADVQCDGPFNDCEREGAVAAAGKRFAEDEAYIDIFGCLEDDFPEFYGLYPSYCRDRPDTQPGHVHSYASEDELFAKKCAGIRLFLGNLPLYWPEDGQPTRFLAQTALHGATFKNFRVWNYNGIPEPSNPRLCSPKYQESCDAYRNSPWCRAYDRKAEVLLDGGKLSDFSQRCAVRCNSNDDCAEDERCVERVYPYDLEELDSLIDGYLESLTEHDPELLEDIRQRLSEEDALNDQFDYRWGNKADLDKYLHNVHRTEDLAFTGLGSNAYQGVCLKGCGNEGYCAANEICTRGHCMCGKGPACPENHWCDGAYCRCGNDDQCEPLETCEYNNNIDFLSCLCGEDECDENETCQKNARGTRLFCFCGRVECNEGQICNSDKQCVTEELAD